jgi:hypothetical protein
MDFGIVTITVDETGDITNAGDTHGRVTDDPMPRSRCRAVLGGGLHPPSEPPLRESSAPGKPALEEAGQPRRQITAASTLGPPVPGD